MAGGVKNVAAKTVDGLTDLASDSARVVIDSARKTMAKVKEVGETVANKKQEVHGFFNNGVTKIQNIFSHKK